VIVRTKVKNYAEDANVPVAKSAHGHFGSLG
jgi:hypothetical protein